DFGGFLQFFGDAGLEEVAGDDHVGHRHAAGQEHGPDGVDQAGILDDQVGGDQTAAKVHGNDKEDVEELASRQIGVGQGVGGDVDHYYREDRAYHGVLDAVPVAQQDAVVREHGGIAFQAELAGQQEGLAGINIVRVGEGRH